MRKQNPKKISYYILKELPVVLLTAIFGIIYNIAFVFVPSFQGKLLDTVVENQPTNIVALSAAIFLAVVLLVQVTRYFKRYYVRRFANKTKLTMRHLMYQSTINQNLASLNSVEAGDLMSRCIGDIEITVEGIRKSITEILDTGIAIISYIVMLLTYDAFTTLISCSFIFIAMLTALFLKTTVYKFSKSYRESSSKLTSKTYELTSNAILLRNHGVADKHIKIFGQAIADTKAKSIKASIIENAFPPIYKVIASIGVIFIVYFGGLRALNGSWTIGEFTAYLTLFLAFTIKASKISNLFNSVQKAKISWNRTNQYFEKTTPIVQSNVLPQKISIAVSDLTFRYDTASIFQPISFSATQGEIIGIMGKIASGKTSVLLALTSLYGYGGSIRLNDKELSLYPKNERSALISYSGHNPQLLDDTIAENISVGRNAEILTLLKDVCFDKDFENMPNKENTFVGDSGVRLSGGQQARISLARALVGQNKIVLLDDPFSAVDPLTEQKIISNLKARHSDKIFIIVSHRPTILDYADKIIDVTSEKDINEEARDV